eukprot:TRINITY_DN20296_c0_g1_i1.p1 TRINITY_DN20296_c0_g1~~TRINITY_DN20296_c0_g1_i1.p1  ORF type:complete len:363 (+),score=37.14 TRINITY_DN20296_c0_g1_i1:143-1231(+)
MAICFPSTTILFASTLCTTFLSSLILANCRSLRLPSHPEIHLWPEKLDRQVVPLRNFQPIIGILSQPGDGDGGEAIHKNDGKLHSMAVGNFSYIAASYVKWAEMGGARVIPILYNEPEDIIRQKFHAVNGLIFPGGGTELVDNQFYRTSKLIWKMILEANDAGDYFPVQATCLGMELVSILASEDMNILESDAFDSHDQPSSLKFVGNWAKDRYMFGWMTQDLLRKVQETNITMENHGDGTTVERFRSNQKLCDFFTILTTSEDRQGKVYVSTIEAVDYPIYGTQWHPEKNCFEWGLDGIPHSADAVAVTQAAANFFVNEARRSGHQATSEEINRFLIYNYVPIFSGKDGKGFFDQSYVFDL